ncbi:MAG: polysaccharide pyruvyl transferase family protein [Anaerostipes sp.]|uniref:polysaccharide pyruvyl transferase family protein n=1 Tax=Anaerostipes sp. TaxID=1872530 RepID=UPI0039961599
MRVGILTFQFANNYGALLQAYALKEYIQREDVNVNIINYVSNHFHIAYSINPFEKKNFASIVKASLKWPILTVQHRKFIDFRNNYLDLFDVEEKEILTYKYDTIVVGSDQVWNLSITNNDMKYFLCEDNDDAVFRKISYAASANDSFPMGKYKNKIQKCLLEFDAISVRENQLKQNLEKIGVNCEVVCDPVFLLKKEKWSELSSNPRMIKQKYILAYMLKENNDLSEKAQQISKKYKLPVVVVHPQGRRLCKVGKMRYDIGVSEFVGLIKNAEYVITNSFHAFAFSLIFSKKIYFECVEGTSNRILNLLEILDISSECLSSEIRYAELSCYGNKLYENYVSKSKAFIEREIIGVRGQIYADN